MRTGFDSLTLPLEELFVGEIKPGHDVEVFQDVYDMPTMDVLHSFGQRLEEIRRFSGEAVVAPIAQPDRQATTLFHIDRENDPTALLREGLMPFHHRDGPRTYRRCLLTTVVPKVDLLRPLLAV